MLILHLSRSRDLHKFLFDPFGNRLSDTSLKTLVYSYLIYRRFLGVETVGSSDTFSGVTWGRQEPVSETDHMGETH